MIKLQSSHTVTVTMKFFGMATPTSFLCKLISAFKNHKWRSSETCMTKIWRRKKKRIVKDQGQHDMRGENTFIRITCLNFHHFKLYFLLSIPVNHSKCVNAMKSLKKKLEPFVRKWQKLLKTLFLATFLAWRKP